jgi:hypothetical protein
MCRIDLSGSGYGPVAGSCEHGDEIGITLRVGFKLTYLPQPSQFSRC